MNATRFGGRSKKLFVLGVLVWLAAVSHRSREARRAAYLTQCFLRLGMTLSTTSSRALTAARPAPKKAASKKASPNAATPNKAASKKAASKKASPNAATPTKEAFKKASPKAAASKKAVFPKTVPSKAVSPKAVPLEMPSFDVAMSDDLEATKDPETTAKLETSDGSISPPSQDQVVVAHRLWPGRVATCAVAVVALFVVAAAAWDLSGGTLLTMETASMCPAICVGALVADQPVHGPVHVGELISFHPTPTSNEVYTHEIMKILPNGAIETRGLANAKPDPWLITPRSITGRVIFSVWELGWVFTIAPFLAVGAALWAFSCLFISRRSRRALTRLWLAALVVIPLWMVRPLVRGEMLASSPYKTHHGWLQEKLLNTGIMPVNFRALGGQAASHVPSTATRQIAGPMNHHGLLTIYESVSLDWWGWIIVALVCLSPLLAYLWHVIRDDEQGPARPRRAIRTPSMA